jgi:signal transduction histidine kinase
VERPTIVIISDEQEFSTAVTRRWLIERHVPSFFLVETGSCDRLRSADYDLAVIGGVSSECLTNVLDVARVSGKPVIHVSRLNGPSPQFANVISLPEIQAWPDLLITVAHQVLARERAAAELMQLLDSSAQLEQQAALGRYMIEVRHNLNNALTSILGNSDLILLDEDQLPSAMRTQVETIRNMGMRMNEILQRFSSLQKEMQLVEQQNWTKNAKSAKAGA